MPDPIPTHLYSFTFGPDASRPYCVGKLDLYFATTQQLADYSVQGMILSVGNGHASYAPIVVPTKTVRPRSHPSPCPGKPSRQPADPAGSG